MHLFRQLNDKRHNLVSGAVITPKARPIKGERTRRERNLRQIFHARPLFAWIEASDAPFFVRLFRATQDVDLSIDKSVAANLRADVDGSFDRAFRIELENALLIPLAQVKVT